MKDWMKTSLATISRLSKSSTARSIVMATIVIGVMAASTYAQQNSNTLQQTAQNLFNDLYTTVRWPVCTIALIPAALSFWSSRPDGRRHALFILAGIFLWALIPTIINLVKQYTGT